MKKTSILSVLCIFFFGLGHGLNGMEKNYLHHPQFSVDNLLDALLKCAKEKKYISLNFSGVDVSIKDFNIKQCKEIEPHTNDSYDDVLKSVKTYLKLIKNSSISVFGPRTVDRINNLKNFTDFIASSLEEMNCYQTKINELNKTIQLIIGSTKIDLAQALQEPQKVAEYLRKAQEEAEALQKAQVEAEALRKAQAEAEALRKAQEEAEALQKAQEEAEALQKAQEEAEAETAKATEAAEAAKALEEKETITPKTSWRKYIFGTTVCLAAFAGLAYWMYQKTLASLYIPVPMTEQPSTLINIARSDKWNIWKY